MTKLAGKLLFLSLFLSIASLAIGQQVRLQIEKYGSPKVIHLYEGDEIRIKLFDDDKRWKPVIIDRIIPDNKTILFDIGVVALDEIKAIRLEKNIQSARTVKRILVYFGGGLILLSPLNLVVGLPYNTTLVAVGGAAIVVGFISEWFIKWVTTHKMGKRKWLRILEIPFEPPIGYPSGP